MRNKGRYGRRHRKDACTGKLRYRTLNEADFEIDRARVLRGEVLRAYLCNRCGRFHLTSQSLEEYAAGKH